MGNIRPVFAGTGTGITRAGTKNRTPAGTRRSALVSHLSTLQVDAHARFKTRPRVARTGCNRLRRDRSVGVRAAGLPAAPSRGPPDRDFRLPELHPGGCPGADRPERTPERSAP